MVIFWTVIITLALAAFVVILVQNLSSSERKIKYVIEPDYPVEDPLFERAIGNLLGPPLVGGNIVTSLQNGVEIFPAMLKAIRGARRSITLEMYIYWKGDVGREFSEAIAERARAGVKVRVLLDWVGSSAVDPESLDLMREAGAEVERYRPLRFYNLARINRRTHRKILVVDGRIGFIGGAGIADQWLGNADSPERWRDAHFQLEGPAVAQLQAAFIDNWLKTMDEVLCDESFFPELPPIDGMRCQVFQSSPREGSASVRLLYLLSIAVARKRILLSNSYFVPDKQSIEAIVAAQKRGVKVEIIVPGPNIDVPFVRPASRALWGPLLKAGVMIYEYQPTFFHCKVMVVDDCWVSVGSTNFDNRSFRLNDEANLNILSHKFAEEQARTFEADKKLCEQITLKKWKQRPIGQKVYEWLASLLRGQL